MKNLMYLIVLFVFILLGNPIISSAQEPQDVVKTYFQAMQNGDVETMKAHMGGKLYEKRKILLEQNRNYPTFLRNHYDGGQIKVGEVNDGVVTVEVQFPDGSINSHHLVVKKDDLGQWKIVDELRKDD